MKALVRRSQVGLLRQADSDPRLIEMWLHGRSSHTQRAYAADIARLLAFTSRPLQQTRLTDLQAFADSLGELAGASRARVLSSVKSLLGFGHRLGYLPFDVGRALRLPRRKDTLAQRILTEEQVLRMLALEPDPRNRVMLRLLYAAGLRVSELCGLTWRDCQVRGKAGQITVFGKGGRTRMVLLSEATWQDLAQLRGGASDEEPVFRSRKFAGHLTSTQVLRIVKAAARRARIKAEASPHWLRHAHASHAIERGAPVHLVQATLGHANLATTGRYLHARPTDSSSRYLAV